MVNQNNKKGFTIIEVVLVLAIAGLIFLMVFIALPALQRGQRDSQRRSDISRFMSQLNSYSTNNNGRVPAASSESMNSFLKSYMKQDQGEFVDPQSGDKYEVTFEGDPTTKKLVYRTGVKCDGENFVSREGGRAAAVRVQLEGSGYFCQDNQ